MTGPEVFHNKHKHDVYLERQIQESLLIADDEFSRKDFLDVIKKTKQNPTKKKGRKKAEDDEFCELSGWVPDKNVSYRKREKCAEDSGNSSSREFISWRDSRSCSLARHHYIFRHYKDTKRYIEQYRKDCTCSKNTGIPSSKEYFDLKRYKEYEKYSMVPNTKTISQKSERKETNSKPHTGTFSYTNRSVSNPFNVYTDFFSGKNVGRVIESDVEQILQSDTDCSAQNDLFARKYTRRESATYKYGKNSATDITTTPLPGNNHQRIASGTKLSTPSKIRTLDGLNASPDYQIDGEKPPHHTEVSLKPHPDARIDNICQQDQSNSSSIISKQCANAQTCCRSLLSDPSHTFQTDNESSDTMPGNNGSSDPSIGASSTVSTDIVSPRPMSVFSRRGHLSLGKLQDINSRNTTSSLSSQSIDSMTWREKLQALRKADKPHFKRKGKPRRLSFYKEDNIVGKVEVGCCDPCLTHRKKIQELIENSKIKLKTICTEMDQALVVRKNNRLKSNVLGDAQLDIDTIINSVRDCQIQNVDDKTRVVCKTKT
ncbi:uncharacterized protein LOC126814863 [Patella vulgata]|uniref:uncharacterized protein LOC126814863 n=1 Tax=Patella vulgata TaxID=6465 RepID=UPI00217F4ABB|nr:uncharacterized protein LOC126814863 [Patella vulgata]